MLELAVAAGSGIALTLAFPKVDAAWLAPVGAAGLFWLAARLSWKRAFALGWFAGAVFFCITFSWFGYTVGSFVGKLAPAIVAIPAFAEALAFGAAAACASVAFRYAPRALAPVAAAAAFVVFEWVRSVGVLGVPFGQLGFTQASTPLAVFAAYGGSYGITFVLCALGAYVAQALITRDNRPLLAAVGTIIVLWLAAFAFWPARHAAAPSFRVAAIQGNIPQSDKSWNERALGIAANRYLSLSERARAFAPQLVVWPETVMTSPSGLNDMRYAYNAGLVRRLGAFSRSAHTTLVTGSIDVHDGQAFNGSYIFSPAGLLSAIYDKRQMVPFAESFPGKSFLSWIPFTKLITGFGTGTIDGVYDADGMKFAPLICWESAFSDLAHAQLRGGAQLLVIATDDAWFGETAGPYQHAQIAQIRAIEAGTWVVRAASTGISGVISPDGRYVQATDLDREALVLGTVGLPPGSVFARLGPAPVVGFCVLLYVALVALGWRRRVA